MRVDAFADLLHTTRVSSIGLAPKVLAATHAMGRAVSARRMRNAAAKTRSSHTTSACLITLVDQHQRWRKQEPIPALRLNQHAKPSMRASVGKATFYVQRLASLSPSISVPDSLSTYSAVIADPS